MLTRVDEVTTGMSKRIAKTLLIVDDDRSALRALARVVALRQPGLRVLTASSGMEALEVLKRESVDVVLTDLRMPEMSGFELLSWIGAHRPTVRSLPMSAHPEAAVQERLAERGFFSLLTKPIDLDLLNHLLEEELRPSLEGYVQGLGLPSFLQLVTMERKTCRLIIEGDTGSGTLHLFRGELVHASLGDETGDAAALQILAWHQARIAVEMVDEQPSRTVTRPVDFLLMEAARLQDEQQESISKKVAQEESGFFRAFSTRGGDVAPPPQEKSTRQRGERQLEQRLRSIAELGGVEGMAVVDVATGNLLAALVVEDHFDAAGIGSSAAEFARGQQEIATLGRDVFEGYLLTTENVDEIVHRILDTGAIVVARVSRSTGVPAMVRVQLATAEGLLARDVRALRGIAEPEAEADVDPR